MVTKRQFLKTPLPCTLHVCTFKDVPRALAWMATQKAYICPVT